MNTQFNFCRGFLERYRRTIACILVAMTQFARVACYAQTGTVKGVVVEDSVNAVWGAVVTLLHANQMVSIQTELGNYLFDDLPPGPDTLRVIALGYYSLVCPITIKPDTITIVDFSPLIVTAYPDPGECGTPVHAYPPPENYIQTHTRIVYIPKSATKAPEKELTE
jgi:hypothetical protein